MIYNPLISIIIPVYNTKRYLDETIGSVLKQTYKNWELILVDDGSTDGSVDLIKDYCNSDIRIRLIEQANSGQGAARNNGIRQAKGDLIAFLDSDDLWTPEKLSIQLEEKVKYGVEFQYAHGYLMYEDQNNKLETYDWISGEFKGLEFFNQLFISCSVNTDTVLMDKIIFDKVGLFDTDPELRGTEDFDLWLRVAKENYKVYGSKERIAYYRIHPGGTHLNFYKQNKGRLKTFRKYLNDPVSKSKVFIKSFTFFIRDQIEIILNKKKDPTEIKELLSFQLQIDPHGLITNLQYKTFHYFGIKTFWFLSQNIIYPIGYRIENLIKSISKK